MVSRLSTKVLIVILSLPLFGDLESPKNNQTIYSTHVKFKWRQLPNAHLYRLIAYNSDSTRFINKMDSTLSHIDKNTFFWGDSISWKIQSFDYSGDLTNTSEINYFQIGQKKFNNIELITNNNTSDINSEIIYFGTWYDWSSGAIDMNGDEIWNDGPLDAMISHVDKYGQIFGSQDYDFDNVPNRGINFNTELDIIWEEPLNTRLDPHDLRRLPNGDIIGLKATSQLGPIPLGPWQEHYQSLGYIADGIAQEVNWVGQKIIIFDHLSNEVVWEWDPFLHYSIDDYDNHYDTWWSLGWGYDWLHSNSVYFDDINNEIYFSNRHISRVAKISFPDGNVQWMMGLPEEYMFNGDSHICNDVLFSFQHDVKLLPNGNILIYDNGNLSPVLFDIDAPRSRILELEVDNDNSCNLVWEYELPQELTAIGMGSTQLLENGNIQITSGNQCGTILEINRSGDILWQVKLGLEDCQNSLYKAFRAGSIYPNTYSTIIENYSFIDYDQIQEGVTLDNNGVRFKIIKESNDRFYLKYYFSKIINNQEEISISDTVLVDLFNSDYSQEDVYLNSLAPGIHQIKLNIKSEPFYNVSDYIEFQIKIDDELDLKAKSQDRINFIMNYPNPFNLTTKLRYNITRDSYVNLIIYDVRGNIVKHLVNENQNSGINSVQWDGKNNQGESVSTGVYLYKIYADNFNKIKKMILMK